MNLLTILLQVSEGAGQVAGEAAQEGGGGGLFGLGSSTNMILMMVALFAIMYFFMIRPQQKKQKALEEARKAIKTGDKVVTAGGLHGKVKDVGETYFIVEIAEGVKIKIEKASVYISAESQAGDSTAK